ncbi:uncharacterized protein B0H18DRAFT_959588 [Fomitopsis serialis]|uniref:uncharacterized protein n=1 Tax=Fomitopsis serialis TaxID=139415 RepID=UPI0020081D4E|nr:uncharacterized protein B0H18DRAFT_959588 [Neoantrodia serialis]KAH9914850.1 hypothetical protein B0H18DRAFT_959588 [Neoantrodia serialis]
MEALSDLVASRSTPGLVHSAPDLCHLYAHLPQFFYRQPPRRRRLPRPTETMKPSLTLFVRPGGDNDRTCPACDKEFHTSQGLMAHLSSARLCAWYRKGKNRELNAFSLPKVVESPAQAVANTQVVDGEVNDCKDILEDRDFFRFELPDAPPPPADTDAGSSGQPSSSMRTAGNSRRRPWTFILILDNNEDTRLSEENKDAGAVIRIDKSITIPELAEFKIFRLPDDATCTNTTKQMLWLSALSWGEGPRNTSSGTQYGNW